MEINVVETNGAYSLLEIHLITGRSHQIRAHLAYLGNPIIGDNKYGDKKLNTYKAIKKIKQTSLLKLIQRELKLHLKMIMY